MDDEKLNKLNELAKIKEEIEKTQKGFNMSDEFKKLADETAKIEKKHIEEMKKMAVEDSKHQEMMNKITLDNLRYKGEEERRKENREQSNADNLKNIFSAIDKQKEDSKIIKTWTIFSAICIFLTLVVTIYLVGLSQCDHATKEATTQSHIAEVKVSKVKTDTKEDKRKNKQADDGKPESKSKP